MEGKIEHRHIPLLLNALIQYTNVWEVEGQDRAVADRAAFRVFTCPVVGPNGLLVTVRMESRVSDTVYQIHGKKERQSPSGWLLQTPAWATLMMEDLIR